MNNCWGISVMKSLCISYNQVFVCNILLHDAKVYIILLPYT